MHRKESSGSRGSGPPSKRELYSRVSTGSGRSERYTMADGKEMNKLGSSMLVEDTYEMPGENQQVSENFVGRLGTNPVMSRVLLS